MRNNATTAILWKERLMPWAVFLYIFGTVALSWYSSKGTSVNTIIKFVLFFVFITIVFFNSKKIAISPISLLCISLYFFIQLWNYFDFQSNEILLNALSQMIMIALVLINFQRIVPSKETVEKIVVLYTIFISVACLYNLIIHFQYYISLSFFNTVNYQIKSFFDNKNTYGGFLFIGLIMCFYLLKTKSRYKFCKVSLGLIIFSILTCLSRTCLFMSVAFMLLYFILSRKANRGKSFLLGLLLVIACLILYFVPIINTFVNSVLIRTNVGSYREPIYNACWQLFGGRPFVGYGENTYGQLLFDIVGNRYTHSSLFHVILSGGIGQLVIYLYIIFLVLKRSIAIYRFNKNIGAISVSACICAIVYGFSENVLICGTSAVSFAFTLCITIIPCLLVNMINNGRALVHDKEDSKETYIIIHTTKKPEKSSY